ncbi:MAG: zinc ribbon domain-containing protein [Lachnospiraceae bacterium]|nr:zinc ribbon domain-containing protein [Lachnospiraceae bacterium]
MKNLKTKILGLLILVFGCLMMTACAGGSLDTKLILEKDGSGVREMDVYIQEDNFRDNFNGTYDDLCDVIRSYCPSALKYEFITTDDGENCICFKLPFDSTEDYNNKIKKIYPDAGEAEIQVSTSEWSKGLKVEENFDSRIFFHWLEDALVEEGRISEGNKSSVVEIRENKIVFDKEYDASSYIYYNDLTYVTLSNVNVMTEVTDIGLYNRTYMFRIDVNSITGRESDIEHYFVQLVGNDAEVTTSENSYYYDFSITKNNLDSAGLEEFAKLLFEDATISCENGDDEKYFAFGMDVKEQYNATNYTFSNYQGISFNGFWKVSDEYSIGSEYEYIAPASYYTTHEDFPGYYAMSYGYYYDDNEEGYANLQFAYARNYRLNYIDTATKAVGDDEYEKYINLVFEDRLSESQEAAAISKIESALLEKSVAEENNAHVSKNDTDDYYAISIEMRGNADEISGYMEGLTGYGDTISLATEESMVKIKTKFVMSEFFDIYIFSKDVTSDFSIRYTLDAGKGKTVTFCSKDTAEISKSTASISTTSLYGLDVSGTAINIKGVIFWVVVVVVLAAIIAIVLVLTCGKKAKAKRAAKQYAMQQAMANQAAMQGMYHNQFNTFVDPSQTAPVQPVVTAEPVQPAMTNEAPGEPVQPVMTYEAPTEPVMGGFCTNCGAPREGGKFCTKCGKPF